MASRGIPGLDSEWDEHFLPFPTGPLLPSASVLLSGSLMESILACYSLF
jgi:hypothetical protein